ncbi:MAG: tetratricopeptide repeat protein [Fuerstiella sp.]
MGFFGRSTGFKAPKTPGEKIAAAAGTAWLIVSFPFRALWRAGAFGVKLTATWWKDRRMVHLLRGLPTLLLAAVCIYFVVGMKPGFSRAEKYRTAGMAACSAEQWETAKLYLERAAALGLTDNDTLFSLARAAEATDDVAKMVAILDKLAPADRPVYVPAHFWKATQILTSGPVQPQQAETARVHLNHILTLDPKHTAANALLGNMYFQQGLWSAAVAHLQKTHPESPRYRLMLAKACLAVDDKIRSEQFARDAQELAKELSDSDPKNPDHRILWAEATTFLEEYEKAAEILGAAFQHEKSALLRTALARVYIHWADSVEGFSEADNQRKFALLAEAMKHNPHEAALFDRLMKILDQQGTVSEDARRFLLRNIAAKRAVGISHLMLGTSAWIDGDDAEASIHLERAFVELPDAATVANNFAWYLANKEPAEPEKALKLIQPILEKAPQNHYIRDTRGHIYLKLGRWKEAVDDLEYAVQALSTNRQTHLGLATAYRNLGLKDLAAEYDRTAKTLE